MSRKSNNINSVIKTIMLILFIVAIAITQYMGGNDSYNNNINAERNLNIISTKLETIPEYKQKSYVKLNNNKPEFTEQDYTVEPFEKYSNLDKLGRCGVAYANICKEIMPDKDNGRKTITSIKPTGWQTTKYEGVVEGNYLYNRCHLIGYQLAGENANKRNLITGTRYMNVEGMLPFENKIAAYIEKNQNNHVLYRVTPIFKGDNLIANGVQMEAYSIEDNGKGICFNIYVYNVQPGIKIDYETGQSSLE